MEAVLEIFGVYKCLWMTVYIFGIMFIAITFMLLQLMEDF